MTGGAPSPEAVFRRQVDAFNARDLDGFLGTYAEDAIVFGPSDGPPLRGQARLREHYAVRLADPALHCDVLETVELAHGFLLARERVTSAAGTVGVTALFRISGDRIARAYLELA